MDAAELVSDITAAEVNAMNGPIIVGQVVALILYGVLASNWCQFLSSSSWKRSGRKMQVLVSVVFALCTASTALYARDLYLFGTTVVKTRAIVEGGDIGSALELVLLGVVSSIVQSVLVIRASKIITEPLWRRLYITSLGLLILLELFGCAASCVYEIRYAIIQEDEYSMGISWTNSVFVWMWTAAGIDVLISASYIFNLTRRLGGVTSTVGADSVLHLIVRLVVQSAAFTAVLAICAASVTAAYPGWDLMTEDLFYAFWIPLPLLYAISLFTTLSIRERVTHTLGNSSGQGFSQPAAPSPLNRVAAAARRGSRHSHRPSGTDIESGVIIHIDKEVLSERLEEPEFRSRGSLMASEKSHNSLHW